MGWFGLSGEREFIVWIRGVIGGGMCSRNDISRVTFRRRQAGVAVTTGCFLGSGYGNGMR